MRERARDIDAFLAVSEFYAARMKKQLDIPDNKLYTHHISLDPDDYIYQNSIEKEQIIGYISRMCYENGLEILVDAFILLKQMDGLKGTRLMITGGNTGDDDKYIRNIKKKIRNSGSEEDVIFHKDFEGEGRRDFFSKVSVISVPVLEGEAFGLYLIESMASGIPVVQPALGAFPEIIDKSGGGLHYSPNDPTTLAGTLAGLLRNPEKLGNLSRNGRQGVEKHFNTHSQASRMIEIYREILGVKNKGKYVTKTG
jgi:glycosyltransferase involved in cell wall biosynthesis